MGASRRWRRRVHRSGGRRVLFVLSSIPDDATPQIKNALAIRNAASRSGACPSCGAVVQVKQFGPRLYRGRFEHQPGCAVLALTR
jgi:hypothetical protein